MNRLAIAVVSALSLSAVRAQATVVVRTYNFYFGGDFADRPIQDLTVTINRNLGRAVSVSYQFIAEEEWNAPIVITGRLLANPTVRMGFDTSIYTDDSADALAWFHTPLEDVTSHSRFGLGMTGILSGSFRDNPNMYTDPVGNDVYGRTLTIFPNINWNGNQVCSGPCHWRVDFSEDQGIGLMGALTQTVVYAPFFVPEPSSFALLTLATVAVGFVSIRGLRGRWEPSASMPRHDHTIRD